MGLFTVGEVIAVAFPYSDLSRYKIRPALIVGKAEYGNLITCQITLNRHGSKRALTLNTDEFEKGTLRVTSFIRPDKLFTLDPSIIQISIGVIQHDKLQQVHASIKDLFS